MSKRTKERRRLCLFSTFAEKAAPCTSRQAAHHVVTHYRDKYRLTLTHSLCVTKGRVSCLRHSGLSRAAPFFNLPSAVHVRRCLQSVFLRTQAPLQRRWAEIEREQAVDMTASVH